MLYNVVLVSAIQYCESTISIHISPLSYPSTHSSRLSQSPWLSFLGYTTMIAVYFTYGNIHVSMLLPQFVPTSPFPAGSTSLLSMSASPFLPCK